MGNRVYVTIDNDTFYLHWNGGPDTWLPIVDAAFKYNKKKDDILELLKALEISFELQNDKDAYNWIEENGHYYIDTTNQTFRRKKRNGYLKYYTFFEDDFNDFIRECIDRDYRQKTYEAYWLGIHAEAQKLWEQ